MSFDAIIVGAGPAGCSAALALAQQGRSVAIVERSAFPRQKVCGEFMSAVNMPILDRLGVGADVRALAGPEVTRLALFASGPSIEAPMPRATGDAFGRALGRDVLDTMLLDAARAAGVAVFQPWRATAMASLGDEGSRVRIETRADTQDISAPVVISAHGSWEPGKLATNLERRHEPHNFLGFKAHFRGASLASDLMPLLVFPGGYGGMVWSDAGRLSLSCCLRRDFLENVRTRHRGSAAEAVYAHIVASCPAVADALDGASLKGEWLAAGPIRPGMRDVYDDDIFRVGNLAGEFASDYRGRHIDGAPIRLDAGARARTISKVGTLRARRGRSILFGRLEKTVLDKNPHRFAAGALGDFSCHRACHENLR